MIASFGDKSTEAVFHGQPATLIRRFSADLDMLNAARTLGDLRSPPGNRLELLRGDLGSRCSE